MFLSSTRDPLQWLDEENPDTDDEKSPQGKSESFAFPTEKNRTRRRFYSRSRNEKKQKTSSGSCLQLPQSSPSDSKRGPSPRRASFANILTLASLSPQREAKVDPCADLCPLPPIDMPLKEYAAHTNIKEISWAAGWTQPDPSFFKLRGKTYKTDHKKINTGPPLFSLCNMDFLACSNGPKDAQTHPLSLIAARSDSYISRMQQAKRLDTRNLHFVLNFLLPLTPPKAIVAYMVQTEETKGTPVAPLLEQFIKGNQDFRDRTLKIIPRIARGPWVVTRAVGTTPALIGQKLTVHYYYSEQYNYMEVDVDVGSSIVGGNLLALVQSYANNLVLDLTFCLQGNSVETLPERLIGGVRIVNGDLGACVEIGYEDTLTAFAEEQSRTETEVPGPADDEAIAFHSGALPRSSSSSSCRRDSSSGGSGSRGASSSALR